MLSLNQNQHIQYSSGNQYYQQPASAPYIPQQIPYQMINQMPQQHIPSQINYQYLPNYNNQQYDFYQQQNMENNIIQGNNIVFQNQDAVYQQQSQQIPQYDQQQYEQLSNSVLDMEIKKNEAQIMLLKQENEKLNEEIQQFNNNQINQQQFQLQIVNNSQPISLSNPANDFDDKPEIAYCTAPILNKKKYYQEGSVTTYGLSVLLQKIHRHLILDYSAIDVKGKSNLFSKDFVEKEIVDKLQLTNQSLDRNILANSKPVYCCNYFHKTLNKYAKIICIGVPIWLFVLSFVYFIGQTSSGYFHLLNILIQIFSIIYMSVQTFMVYLSMKKCSLTFIKVAQFMSMINFFIQFGNTSLSMSLLGGEHGFGIVTGFLVIFIVNVINMFIQMFILAQNTSLVLCMKRFLAVILQIPSTELVM
ncbi:transmembrane protein, putative (macronuclear) [Tetrahymena thermophila SB210]|uniref:Transmembrane protein, putative n=1 Tax=Tetrahymena thermophila (strain SB210) TaxID=312017 RepID=Q22E56_TETTS|nr:transmembrane protein, putative [Tetrahymena thermophila SB210]EAR83558.2 transmembrane protein, putative [Tetrahymena thermophila SB210]|eukprot:XP_001031221.2 transmembrane protein, putative [Tetrahymena thermophila SB210]